jgi:membrane glycosyltransferase
MNQRFPSIPWQRTARLRRLLLLGLILVTSFIASAHMADVLPHRGTTWLELAVVIVFAILFAWISIGFWEALAGLLTLARHCDRFAVTPKETEKVTLESSDALTAILIPIANEEVDRVFAGLRVIHESLAKTGELHRFHFFVLSDSGDPDKWVEEEIAWAETCRALDAFNRVFYRRRQVNLKRKSGNIADFCRRWGRSYRYMVVLDADSIMAGSTLVKMVWVMEKHPHVGILQTAPVTVDRETAVARTQQFANHVYGPVFAAGLHWIQLGDSHFWGHNAIIRVKPFMEHCALPQLPGKPPRGGYIMSHDFVEAAFMRRGGWEVWLAHDLGGSYEEAPPTLLEELKRDRRWCQGNLQHIRLLFTKGLMSAHRALFLHGAMSYGSSLLWFTFISLSTAEAIAEAFRTPVYFPTDRALFPEWPVWHPQWALTLLSTTAIILFMPKLFSVFLLMAKGQALRFGGNLRLCLSLAGEVLFSAMFAPIRMLFHSKFVFVTLLGRQVGWGPQQRDDRGTPWGEALRFHGGGMALALLWAGALFLINRSFFFWNSPIFIPLILSIPLSVLSSRSTVGRWLRKLGFFLIPEEIAPSPELESLRRNLYLQEISKPSLPMGQQAGFVKAVIDPWVNNLHLSLLRRKRRVAEGIAKRRQRLQDKAFFQGPRGLSAKEKKELLHDPVALFQLHQRVWESPDQAVAQRWGLPS